MGYKFKQNKLSLTELDHKAFCRHKANVPRQISSSWTWVLLAYSGNSSSLSPRAFVYSYRSLEVPITDLSQEGPFSSSVPFSVPPFAFAIKHLVCWPSGVLVGEPGFLP